MHVILEYFPAYEDAGSHIYITEGDLSRIEKWCENFPDQMALIAATTSIEHTYHPILPWNQVIEESAWDLSFNYHLETDIESNLLKVDREDARHYATKLRDTLASQLRDAYNARQAFAVTDNMWRRVVWTIRHKVKLVRKADELLSRLSLEKA